MSSNIALNKVNQLRKRCMGQKTIRAHIVVDELLEVVQFLQSYHKTHTALHNRVQRAETEVKRLKARIRELENS